MSSYSGAGAAVAASPSALPMQEARHPHKASDRHPAHHAPVVEHHITEPNTRLAHSDGAVMSAPGLSIDTLEAQHDLMLRAQVAQLHLGASAQRAGCVNMHALRTQAAATHRAHAASAHSDLLATESTISHTLRVAQHTLAAFHAMMSPTHVDVSPWKQKLREQEHADTGRHTIFSSKAYFDDAPPEHNNPTPAQLRTALFMAELSADSYDSYKVSHAKSHDVTQYARRLSPEELKRKGLDKQALEYKPLGVYASVYQLTKNIGKYKKGEFITAYRGTAGWRSGLADVELESGYSNEAYVQAATIALLIKNKLGKELVAFTGHSYGGGEASIAALVTHTRAFTFNAEGVSDSARAEVEVLPAAIEIQHKEHLTEAQKNNFVTAYHVNNEPVTSFQENFQGRLAIHRAVGSSIDLPAVWRGHLFHGEAVLKFRKEYAVNHVGQFFTPIVGGFAVSMAADISAPALYMHSIQSVEAGIQYRVREVGGRIVQSHNERRENADRAQLGVS